MPCSSAPTACSSDDPVGDRHGLGRRARRPSRRSCPGTPPRPRGRRRRTRRRPSPSARTRPAPSSPSTNGSVHRVDALALVGVDVVDAGRGDLDQQLARAGGGVGQLGGGQDLRSAGLGDLDRAHGGDHAPLRAPSVSTGRSAGDRFVRRGGVRLGGRRPAARWRDPQRGRGHGHQRRAEHVQRRPAPRARPRAYCDAAERALGQHGRDQQRVAAPHAAGRGDRAQREPEPDEQPEVAEQQVGVQLGEGWHLDVQPRGGGVAGVRPGRGDQRAGHQQRGQHGGAGGDQPAHRRRGPAGAGRAVALGRRPATSSTASQMNTIETRKCTATLHQTSPLSTTNPPITACATTPTGWATASRTSRRRRGRMVSAASRPARRPAPARP